MSWTKHIPQKSAHGTGLRLPLVKRGARPARLNLSIKPSVLREIGAEDEPGADLFFGHGEDAGNLLIVAGRNRAIRFSTMRHTRILRAGHVPALRDMTIKAADCAWEVAMLKPDFDIPGKPVAKDMEDIPALAVVIPAAFLPPPPRKTLFG